MFLMISALKLITEMALLALFGQWILGLLAGQRKQNNVFYQVLEIIGRPFVQLTRWFTPRIVLDRHLPLVAFLILGFVWLAVTAAKISHCLKVGVALCQ
ncbi:hypothetical protein [Hydrogenophaga sp.]|uniref:hypothetical protein n=1 Tax=Hydrogenophaga sp. TaxID=1904254 RepID=UPI003F6A5B86